MCSLNTHYNCIGIHSRTKGTNNLSNMSNIFADFSPGHAGIIPSFDRSLSHPSTDSNPIPAVGPDDEFIGVPSPVSQEPISDHDERISSHLNLQNNVEDSGIKSPVPCSKFYI